MKENDLIRLFDCNSFNVQTYIQTYILSNIPICPPSDLFLPVPDMSLEYRLALDPDIAMKLRSCEAGEIIKFVSTDTLLVNLSDNGSSSSNQQQQSYSTTNSSGGRDQRLGLITNHNGGTNHHGQSRNGQDVLAEGSSLLPSSSSSSSFALTGTAMYKQTTDQSFFPPTHPPSDQFLSLHHCIHFTRRSSPTSNTNTLDSFSTRKKICLDIIRGTLQSTFVCFVVMCICVFVVGVDRLVGMLFWYVVVDCITQF